MRVLSILAVLIVVVAGFVFAFRGGRGGPTPSVANPPAFVRVAIDQGSFAQALHANGVGDLDGDGRVDVAVAGDQQLVWFRNPEWTGQVIAEGRYGKGSTVVVHDLDGDGRNDVITGDPATLTMYWFRNTGGSWVRYTLTDEVLCHNIDFGDLNGDGRTDMACADASAKQKLVWLVAPVDPTQVWAASTIDPSRAVWGAKIADIDRDGRLDVVSGRAWYGNTGASPWPRYPFTESSDSMRPRDVWQGAFFNDQSYLSVLDLNGDGRLDIVATLFAGSPEGRVSAFLAPSDPTSGGWQEVVLDPGPLFSVHSQAAADFDGSGRVQVMVGEMEVGGYGFGVNPDPKILIYRLTGSAADASGWERIRINGGIHEAAAVDVDKDGRVDILAGDENSERLLPPQPGTLSLWRNVTAAVPAEPAPVNQAAPTVSGSAEEGQTLQASSGTWSGSPSDYRYEWRRCDNSGEGCVTIAAAAAASYTLTADDVASTIRATVTATNNAGSASALSNPTAAIAAKAVPAPPPPASLAPNTGFEADPGRRLLHLRHRPLPMGFQTPRTRERARSRSRARAASWRAG